MPGDTIKEANTRLMENRDSKLAEQITKDHFSYAISPIEKKEDLTSSKNGVWQKAWSKKEYIDHGLPELPKTR